ncbi:MAG: hypothetical protein KF819_12940 [Labilithrix sp.]|nr:hypothetical protein [Labilithrix sp.]
MRSGLAVTLGISLGAHAAAALLFFVPARAASDEPLDPPPQIAGETFEVPAPETAATPLANASPSPDTLAAPAAVDDPDAPARPSPPARARAGARPSHQGRPSAGHAPPGPDGAPGSTGTSQTYGAVGDRSAADLATAFTRGFPQAASGDPAWRTAPIGPAGEAIVTLTIDESGHITDTQMTGSPSAALAAGVRRTLTLIKGRPFVARGKTTKLRLTATVSTDTVHDGLHGDVFAIGGSFAAGEGAAFFALAIGRRIDLRVRLQ